jgi:hypothetical protein
MKIFFDQAPGQFDLPFPPDVVKKDCVPLSDSSHGAAVVIEDPGLQRFVFLTCTVSGPDGPRQDKRMLVIHVISK